MTRYLAEIDTVEVLFFLRRIWEIPGISLRFGENGYWKHRNVWERWAFSAGFCQCCSQIFQDIDRVFDPQFPFEIPNLPKRKQPVTRREITWLNKRSHTIIEWENIQILEMWCFITLRNSWGLHNKSWGILGITFPILLFLTPNLSNSFTINFILLIEQPRSIGHLLIAWSISILST